MSFLLGVIFTGSQFSLKYNGKQHGVKMMRTRMRGVELCLLIQNEAA